MPTNTQRKILNTSMPNKLYFEVEKWAEKEAKTKAELNRDALRQYINGRKRWQEIRKWGTETAKKFNIKNEDDVERILDEMKP